jgi:hypothetical protein
VASSSDKYAGARGQAWDDSFPLGLVKVLLDEIVLTMGSKTPRATHDSFL